MSHKGRSMMDASMSRPQRNAVLVRRETLESVAEAFKGYDDNDGLDFISSENIGEDADLTVGDIRRALKSTTPPGSASEQNSDGVNGMAAIATGDDANCGTSRAPSEPSTTPAAGQVRIEDQMLKGYFSDRLEAIAAEKTPTPAQAPGDAVLILKMELQRVGFSADWSSQILHERENIPSDNYLALFAKAVLAALRRMRAQG